MRTTVFFGANNLEFLEIYNVSS